MTCRWYWNTSRGFFSYCSTRRSALYWRHVLRCLYCHPPSCWWWVGEDVGDRFQAVVQVHGPGQRPLQMRLLQWVTADHSYLNLMQITAPHSNTNDCLRRQSGATITASTTVSVKSGTVTRITDTWWAAPVWGMGEESSSVNHVRFFFFN